MQQNIRAGLDFMTRDIRMMAFGSLGDIIAATGTSLRFTMDLNEDGDVFDPEEDLTYSLYIDGSGKQNIGRMDNTSGLPQNGAVAENIDRIEFYYTLDDGSQTTTPTAVNLVNIRSVTISILARADRPDRTFINSTVYTAASNTVWDLNGGGVFGNAAMDNFRRRLLTSTIQCRNMGL